MPGNGERGTRNLGLTMRRLRASILAALVVVIVLAPAAFAGGGDPSGQPAETTVADYTPAVVIDQTPEAAEEEAWTFRFLVPTVLAASGIAIVGVVLGYGLRIRGRYRVAR